MGAKRDIRQITKLDMVRYAQSQLNNADWSYGTYNKHVKTLRTFFNWLVKLEALDASPMGEIKLKAKPARLDRDNAISEWEYQKIVEYAYEKARYRRKPRDYALVLFAGDTGARPGEITSVRMSMLDLAQKRAIVDGKVGKRYVWFEAECAVALAAYFDWRRVHGPGLVDDYIWKTDGTRLSNPSIPLRRLALEAGLRSMGTYYYRHRKGYQLTDAKVPVTVAARVMGHDPETFIKYYGASDLDSARDAARDLAYRPKALSFPETLSGDTKSG
jgi:site-specific recombinase XerD